MWLALDVAGDVPPSSERPLHYGSSLLSQASKASALAFAYAQRARTSGEVRQMMEGSDFFQRAYDIVRQVPEGRVATYGQVARMMGEPRKARYVGFAMHSSPGMKGGVPCHRIVFADGSLAPGFAFGGADEQRKMLEAEGVGFLSNGKVDLRQYLWEA